jgi:hypothetical protein
MDANPDIGTLHLPLLGVWLADIHLGAKPDQRGDHLGGIGDTSLLVAFRDDLPYQKYAANITMAVLYRPYTMVYRYR